MRRAAKVDNSQQAIVDAIEAEGWEWWHCRFPCDGVCWHPVLDVLQQAELKTIHDARRKPAVDTRQTAQRKFLAWTSTPIWTSPEQALAALRARYPQSARPEIVELAKRIKSDFDREWSKDQSVPGARQRVSAVSGADIETNPAAPADVSLSSRVAAGNFGCDWVD